MLIALTSSYSSFFVISEAILLVTIARASIFYFLHAKSPVKFYIKLQLALLSRGRVGDSHVRLNLLPCIVDG